jgi:hypothetical protein
MRKQNLAAAFLLLLPSTLLAGLTWEQTQLEFRPDASALEVHGEFHFTNTGRTAVIIESVTPECGCTTATLEKAVYQPGEKGRIAAVFTIGQRRGDQTKHIRVQIAGEKEPIGLTLLTHIAEAMRLTPDFVYWQAGEPPSPKTITATVIEDKPLTITKISTSNSKFHLEQKAVREGREYRILVTPEDTASDVIAVITIETLAGTEHARTFQAYAQVKPPVK